VLIVYGSLYPWHFATVHQNADPLWTFLHSWQRQPLRNLIRDAVVNVALYVPLGFVGHLAFRKSRLPGFSIYGPVLLGVLLSVAMELTQLLEPARDSNIADVMTNVMGSALGVSIGLVFEALTTHGGAGKSDKSVRDNPVADQSALMLVFCWVGWLLFPLFPVISPYQLSRKLTIFEHARLIDPVLIVSTAGSWFAAGLLLTAAGARTKRAWFVLTLLAVPAQFFVVERQPLPSLLLGAIAGVVLFLARRRVGAPAKAEAWAFLAVIVLRGLSPFHFVAASTDFTWFPFVATLQGEWQSAAGVLIEKMYYYGTAIWLLRAAGFTLMRSVIPVATALALIEVAQIHLPGRTPEITDPILATLMGFVLAMLSRPVRGRLRTARLE
jgi:VanZ family protein